MRVTAELRDWHYHQDYEVYTGEIFNDSKHRWKDGHRIVTSHVENIVSFEHEIIVETLNSVYYLRKVFETNVSERTIRDYLMPNMRIANDNEVG